MLTLRSSVMEVSSVTADRLTLSRGDDDISCSEVGITPSSSSSSRGKGDSVSSSKKRASDSGRVASVEGGLGCLSPCHLSSPCLAAIGPMPFSSALDDAQGTAVCSSSSSREILSFPTGVIPSKTMSPSPNFNSGDSICSRTLAWPSLPSPSSSDASSRLVPCGLGGDSVREVSGGDRDRDRDEGNDNDDGSTDPAAAVAAFSSPCLSDDPSDVFHCAPKSTPRICLSSRKMSIAPAATDVAPLTSAPATTSRTRSSDDLYPSASRRASASLARSEVTMSVPSKSTKELDTERANVHGYLSSGEAAALASTAEASTAPLAPPFSSSLRVPFTSMFSSTSRGDWDLGRNRALLLRVPPPGLLVDSPPDLAFLFSPPARFCAVASSAVFALDAEGFDKDDTSKPRDEGDGAKVTFGLRSVRVMIYLRPGRTRRDGRRAIGCCARVPPQIRG
mmetsp:Transcript_31739/g.94992  ORF Transcript_31739/g.94992 Transcript_31739/m.94992 type:complete len:449 (-) Transcript_31739:168-1514(-)